MRRNDKTEVCMKDGCNAPAQKYEVLGNQYHFECARGHKYHLGFEETGTQGTHVKYTGTAPCDCPSGKC